jgi:hypothetical protein
MSATMASMDMPPGGRRGLHLLRRWRRFAVAFLGLGAMGVAGHRKLRQRRRALAVMVGAFGEGVADMGGDRSALAVVPAVAHPVA